MSKKKSATNLASAYTTQEYGSSLGTFTEACARRTKNMSVEAVPSEFALFHPQWDISKNGSYGVGGALVTEGGMTLREISMSGRDEVHTALKTGIMAFCGSRPCFVSSQFLSQLCRVSGLSCEAATVGSPERDMFLLHAFRRSPSRGTQQMVTRRTKGGIPVLVSMHGQGRSMLNPEDISSLFATRQAFSVCYWRLTDASMRVIEAMPNEYAGCRAAVRFTDPTWEGSVTAEPGIVTEGGLFIPYTGEGGSKYFARHTAFPGGEAVTPEGAERILSQAEQGAFALSARISRLGSHGCADIAGLWETSRPWEKSREKAAMFADAGTVRRMAAGCTDAAGSLAALTRAFDATHSDVSFHERVQEAFSDILSDFLSSYGTDAVTGSSGTSGRAVNVTAA